jgi:Zn-dependent alcohol dehydrogenase
MHLRRRRRHARAGCRRPAAITADDIADGPALNRKGGTCMLTGMRSPVIGPINVNVQEFILMNKNLCGTVFGSGNPRSDIAMLAGLYQSGDLRQ